MLRLPDAKEFVLPNRQAFSDFITQQFLKYYPKIEQEFKEEIATDPCLSRRQDGAGVTLQAYQELVRDYLAEETPYRGLLLYHGLGTGKTISAISIAESLLSKRRVFVLVQASLQENFIREMRKLGGPLFSFDNHWQWTPWRGDPAAQAYWRDLYRLSQEFVDTHDGVWAIHTDKPANFDDLSHDQQQAIADQIEDSLQNRYTMLTYNGQLNNRERVNEMFKPDANGVPTENPFHHSVVIVDEAHDLVSQLMNTSQVKLPIYYALLRAVDCKIVFLSGTPIINRPLELAYAFNILRGEMEAFAIPAPPSGSVINTEELLKKIPEIDTASYESKANRWLLTRNPANFVRTDDGTAVRFDAQRNGFDSSALFLEHLKKTLNDAAPGWGDGAALAPARTAFPIDSREFAETFIDWSRLKVKNADLFMRRIQGLVSFFKGVDDSKLPRRIALEASLVEVPMSSLQFVAYQKARFQEIRQESSRAKFGRNGADDDFPGSFRSFSTRASNYAVPDELARDLPESNDDVDGAPDMFAAEARMRTPSQVLAQVRAKASTYVSREALTSRSPKYAAILDRIEQTQGTQFVFSRFVDAQGLGFFAEVLRANGYQEYLLKKQGDTYVEQLEDPTSTKPCYAFYTGEDRDVREIYRLIFNNEWDYITKTYPGAAGLIDGFKKRFGDDVNNLRGTVIKVLLISTAGAQGINLFNVRHVHIMEPGWNAAKMDQVVGRAIRLCSHAMLPPEERTVQVSFYLSVFQPEDINANENNAALLRKSDTITKRYLQEYDPELPLPGPAPATTDEILYNIAYEKRVIGQEFGQLLKNGAIDCEIFKPLHRREQPAIHCMRSGLGSSPDEAAWSIAGIEEDAKDEEKSLNMVTNKRTVQRVRIKNAVFILGENGKTLFDNRVFDASQRLIAVGEIVAPGRVLLLNV